MTISAFEESIGVSNGYVNSISKSIGIDRLNLLIDKYSNLDIEWVLTGRGEMYKTKRTTNDFFPDDRPNFNEKGTKKIKNYQENQELFSGRPLAIPSSSPQDGIPLIPLEAMAGALTSEQTVIEYECERYIVPAFKGADFLITVCGTSMIPTYYPGDIVACKRVPMSDLFFQWNKVYVIDTTQGPLIKRIKPGSDKEHILIVSDNEKYDQFELPCPTIRAVSLVIGVIRLE